jgi:antirestriction protein ArdC
MGGRHQSECPADIIGIRTQKTVHARITEEIVAAIAAGAPKFEMPWHGTGHRRGRPVNAASRIPYRGVNVLALWIAAEKKGYPTGTWATYRQWSALDAQVRKGETGSLIVFFKEIERHARMEETNEQVIENYLVARASWVFNADQVKGWRRPSAMQPNPADIHAKAEAFIQSTGADIRTGADMACYSPGPDYIEVPDRGRFIGSATSSPTESYYATVLHELTHWTGHPQRLDRDLSTRFGDNAYAMEELVAELGAAFLCADLEITNSPRADHAAYIGNWITVLGSDPRAIFFASARAGAAVDYLTGLQPGPRAMTH